MLHDFCQGESILFVWRKKRDILLAYSNVDALLRLETVINSIFFHGSLGVDDFCFSAINI